MVEPNVQYVKQWGRKIILGGGGGTIVELIVLTLQCLLVYLYARSA